MAARSNAMSIRQAQCSRIRLHHGKKLPLPRTGGQKDRAEEALRRGETDAEADGGRWTLQAERAWPQVPRGMMQNSKCATGEIGMRIRSQTGGRRGKN
eukprot:scaffold1222_cov317-Pavlova_lutheri.AAC.20